jgi:hypothetical protein
MGDVIPLKKDGTPVVPICIECACCRKPREYTLTYLCYSPHRKGQFNPITGWEYSTVTCDRARASNDDCGMSGRWYEPKAETIAALGKKPSLSERIVTWFDGRFG